MKRKPFWPEKFPYALGMVRKYQTNSLNTQALALTIDSLKDLSKSPLGCPYWNCKICARIFGQNNTCSEIKTYICDVYNRNHLRSLAHYLAKKLEKDLERRSE